MEYKTSKEEKFESIYRAYHEEIYKASLYYTRDEHTAKDIAQKAFFQFYKHMDNVKLKCARAYLLRTVKNLCYNVTRDTKYTSEEDVLEREVVETEREDVKNPEETYIRREEKEQAQIFYDSIMEHLRNKNESWYDALNKVYCMNVPVEEFAEELGVSCEVVYSRLYRAKRWIRKNYEKEYEEVLYKS